VETAAAAVRDIAIAAGVAPSGEMILALEAVENSVMLRELMHHFAFRQIRIKS
jgi:hypothetical protein